MYHLGQTSLMSARFIDTRPIFQVYVDDSEAAVASRVQNSDLFRPICSCSKASVLRTDTCIHAFAQIRNLGSVFALLLYLTTPHTHQIYPQHLSFLSSKFISNPSLLYISTAVTLNYEASIASPLDPSDGLLTGLPASTVASWLSIHALARMIF